MKRFNKKICSVFFAVLVICIGSKLISKLNERENDYSKLDRLLTKNEYTYSDIVDYEYLNIITFDSKTSNIISNKEYKVQNNDSLDLSIEKDKSFIISLPIFSTTIYRWDIANDIMKENLNLDNKSTINGEKCSKSKETIGDSKERQNFYFSNVDAGSGRIEFLLSSPEDKCNDNFKVTLNILRM